MDALSKARMVRKIQRWFKFAVVRSVSESKKFSDKIPPVGFAEQRATDASRASQGAAHIICSRRRSQTRAWSLKLMFRERTVATRCHEQHNFLCTRGTWWFLQAWPWPLAAAADASGLPWDSLVKATLVDFHLFNL